MASADSLERIQEIYIAYYGRPADPAGLTYWANRLEEEGALASIIDHFANSDESQALYGGLSNEVAIDAIYAQLFDRAPDTAGKNYYLGELDNPQSHVTLQSMALGILLGAQGDDATVVMNKLAFTQVFTGGLSENEEAVYDEATASSVKALMATVDASPESLSSALFAVPNFINDLAGHGRSFVLEPGIDDLEGANNDDSFTASVAGTFRR